MKVFVAGATGYIGSHVSAALRRAGHEVWGLARSDPKARQLEREEIHPVRGTLQQGEALRSAAAACSVVVYAASDSQGDTLAIDRAAIESLLGAAERGPRPKTFVYTSGVWVYGDTSGRLVDETSPLNPAALVARRPEVEQLVLSAPEVHGLVIRPGCVYGGQGGLTGLWFAGALANDLQAVGDGENRWPVVHVEDLAEAYVAAVESGCRREVFNVTDRSRHTVAEMVAAAGRAAGFSGQIRWIPAAQAAATMGPLAEALALDQHVDSRKAVRRLGWQPKHGGFVDEVETYFAAWKAAQEKI